MDKMVATRHISLAQKKCSGSRDSTPKPTGGSSQRSWTSQLDLASTSRRRGERRIRQELIRRWDTRTWRDVSSYIITYLLLNYDTPVFPEYFLSNAYLLVTYLHCVRKKVTPCVLFYNSGKWCRILTKFCVNNAASNCKQMISAVSMPNTVLEIE